MSQSQPGQPQQAQAQAEPLPATSDGLFPFTARHGDGGCPTLHPLMAAAFDLLSHTVTRLTSPALLPEAAVLSAFYAASTTPEVPAVPLAPVAAPAVAKGAAAFASTSASSAAAAAAAAAVAVFEPANCLAIAPLDPAAAAATARTR